ncbi:sodium:solute symporter family protein [Maribacter sp. HTCC2170]|uniref:sodium:solute symporter family protein n=1 Tax=Maribacter sp. (strain HTCC2170 / KCCM 42371) TaxID=313603 RepID=UPI00006AFD66|nr:sodium:solute symporter family protein [Maribacter sp. HTCC2170]EAR01387.1 sodium:solute symporter family protein [Maribacter sp. HTCC2170]
MGLELLDWVVIVGYLLLSIGIGVFVVKHDSKNITDFFVAGRNLPWWLLGTSIAATWFATDAPLAVTALVRTKGIYGNWLWWYLGTGIMMMVFFYAKYWRRAEILTDAEMIELRYSGRSASILRGFTAAFFGIFKNCISLGWIMLAMLKFSNIMLGWSAEFALGITLTFALIHTLTSGIKGVVILDMLHFSAGTISTIILAILVLVQVGGPTALGEQLAASTDAPMGVLDMFPDMSHIGVTEMIAFVCLIGVLWLGQAQGDGYIVQRLFSAKNERHAIKASLWFAVAGVVILTWPWIVVGLGSIVILPISGAPEALLADPELAYPMMINEVLPVGLRGLLVAAFMAAFMSTVDTHLCWGGSYMVNDIYKRFINEKASDNHYMLVSRVSIVLLLLLSAVAAWQMDSIAGAWIYIIEIVSGIAIILMLRWFWWRINAWSEITSMLSALILANGFLWVKWLYSLGWVSEPVLEVVNGWYHEDVALIRATILLLLCTTISILVTFMTKPVDNYTLLKFYKKVRPKGWWGPIAKQVPDIVDKSSSRDSWLGFLFGVIFLNSILFSVGHAVLGGYKVALVLLLVGIGSGWLTLKLVTSVKTQEASEGH